LSKVIFLYNFRCRTRIAGGLMIRDYVANQSKDNNKTGKRIFGLLSLFRYDIIYIKVRYKWFGRQLSLLEF
ncbi:hypothetical protein, partial [uncultured Veillonella sp.]|uniref:hypothetical protein n=1 Tax=uncultured Veillonella sp. TaxID=159268 RepID=UPI0028D03DF8